MNPNAYQLPTPSYDNASYPEIARQAFDMEHQKVEARFAARQNCESVKTEDGAGVVFENGAYYRCVDKLGNAPVLENFKEPPVDDLDWELITMRLLFAEIKYEQAATAFLRLRKAVVETVAHRQRGLAVQPLAPDTADQLKALKAECDFRAERVETLKAAKANHPEMVRRRTLAEESAALHREELQAEHARNSEALAVSIKLPGDTQRKAESSMSRDMFGL